MGEMPSGVLREGDDLADGRLAGHQRHQPVEPRGDAAVRRRAVLERLQQEPEPSFCACSSEMPRKRKIRALQLGVVDPDRARGQLHAVAHQVVEVALHLAGPALEVVEEPLLRHGEHVVRGVPLLLLLVPLEEREVDDPAERRTRRVFASPSSRPSCERTAPERRCRPSGSPRRPCRIRSPGFAPSAVGDLRRLLGEELRDRRRRAPSRSPSSRRDPRRRTPSPPPRAPRSACASTRRSREPPAPSPRRPPSTTFLKTSKPPFAANGREVLHARGRSAGRACPSRSRLHRLVVGQALERDGEVLPDGSS